MNYLYKILLEPHSKDPDIRNRELVLNYVLIGLILLVAVEFINSVVGFVLTGQNLMTVRLYVFFFILIFFLGLYWLNHNYGQVRIAALATVLSLTVIASSVVQDWGILIPVGVLLFSLVIVMAGILLGSRYALYSAILSVCLLAFFEHLKTLRIITPNLTWMERPSSMSDVLAFAVVYIIIALVLWLYNQQMERSLIRAQKSETALERQNERLEELVRKRTEQLELAQLEKLQQVYRFAELGRISSALFHDLANHLTTVSLDIEDLGEGPRSELMKRVQNNIGYIDDVVQRVRLQLRGQSSIERFNVGREINKVISVLNYRLTQLRIDLILKIPSKAVYFEGDVIPFRQIISNLLSNAIDAYSNTKSSKRLINVDVRTDQDFIIISVTDWGVGIKPENLGKIFDPFYSSKSDGTGIGLFIIKQIIENDLGGNINVTSNSSSGTTFTITISQLVK